jgi:hypothetical protein
LALWYEYVWVKVPRFVFGSGSWSAYAWAMDPKSAFESAYGSAAGIYKCFWR